MQNIARHSGPKTQMKQDEEGEKLPVQDIAIIRVPGNAPRPRAPLQGQYGSSLNFFSRMCVAVAKLGLFKTGRAETPYRLSIYFLSCGWLMLSSCVPACHYSSSLLSHKHTPWRLPHPQQPAMRCPRRAALGSAVRLAITASCSNNYWSLLNKNAYDLCRG
jgi:hypothetical protein